MSQLKEKQVGKMPKMPIITDILRTVHFDDKTEGITKAFPLIYPFSSFRNISIV